MYQVAGWQFCMIFIFLSLIVSPGVCSSSILPSGVENPLPEIFPDVLSAPKPPLLVEGTRVTYLAITTSVDSYYPVQQDGKDYHEGKSGIALIQTDVVGIDENTVATASTLYIPSGMQGMRPYPGFGSRSPEGCGDFWCSPFWLQSLSDIVTSNYKITRIPLTIEGEEYDAVRFDFFQAEVPLSLTYDRETGVLLYITNDYSSSTHAIDDQTLSNWGSYSTLQLQNVRTYEVPWKSGNMPDWVSPGVTLSYSGLDQLIIPEAQGMNTPFSATLSIESKNDRSSYNSIVYYGQLPLTEKTNAGIYSMTGAWKPVGSVSIPNDVFDQDPDTGFISSVQEDGQDGIVIRRSNSIDYYEDYMYDKTGMLRRIDQIYSPNVATSVGYSTDRHIILELTT